MLGHFSPLVYLCVFLILHYHSLSLYQFRMAIVEEVVEGEDDQLAKVEALKKEGNELFGKGEFDKAHAKYQVFQISDTAFFISKFGRKFWLTEKNMIFETPQFSGSHRKVPADFCSHPVDPSLEFRCRPHQTEKMGRCCRSGHQGD